MEKAFTVGKRVMVLVTGLSTILGLIYFAIYGAALLRAEPQFELRFCGVDQQRPIIVGYSSYLVVGLSTEREDAPVVRSLSLESLGPEPLHFKESDMFKLSHGDGTRVVARWSGERMLNRNHFILFSVPYEVAPSQRTQCDVTIALTLRGNLAPERWGAPWSLVSLPLKERTVVRRFVWKPEPSPGEETGFRVEPHQSVELQGQAARDSVLANSKGAIDLDIVELFEDGTYKRSKVHRSPPAESPSAHP